MDVIGDLIDRLLLPPGLLLVLLAVGLLLAVLKRHRAGLITLSAGCAILVVLSLPPVTGALLAPLEDRYPDLEVSGVAARGARGVVLLGGGTNGGGQLSPRGTTRAVTAALLALELRLPVITTGGARVAGTPTEAELAARLLVDLGVPSEAVRREDRSRTTWENATRVRDLAPAVPLILVTSALHMTRAVASFRAVGLEVIPAPSDRAALQRTPRLLDWLPDASAFALSIDALHEYVGIVAYRVAHGVSRPDR